jgi:hypothetical protein
VTPPEDAALPPPAVLDDSLGWDAYEGDWQSDLETSGFWKESEFRQQFDRDKTPKLPLLSDAYELDEN